jgi:hypothetical protein
MSAEEDTKPFLDAPVCIGPHSPINFECIRLIVVALRGGSFNVMTLRMILLQIDRGLAMMAPTTGIEDLDFIRPSISNDFTLDQQLVRIEELIAAPEFPTTAGIKEEVLRMLLDYLMKLLIDLLTKPR